MDIKIKKKLVKNWFKILQDIICNDIEELEGKKNIFKSKVWFRDKNKKEGGGEFRILTNGKIFEKVGVNFSEVYGKFSKKFRNQIPGTNKSPNFWASGISIVMHMKNPHIPAMHFNTRYIYTSHGWFGGGMDVTPCMKDDNLKKWFHTELKKSCDRHNKNYYKKYKKWCDNYFYLPHRKEPRGIGWRPPRSLCIYRLFSEVSGKFNRKFKSQILGGKKRLPYPSYILLGNTRACISYVYPDIFAGRHHIVVTPDSVFDRHVLGRDCDRAATRHSVTGVNCKVNHYLLELAWISSDQIHTFSMN